MDLRVSYGRGDTWDSPPNFSLKVIVIILDISVEERLLDFSKML